jgi:hypothetical protein
MVAPATLRSDGFFESRGIFSFTIAPNDSVPPRDTVPVPRVRFSATGGIIDTIGWDLHVEQDAGRRREDAFRLIAGVRYSIPRPPPVSPPPVPRAEGQIFVRRGAATSGEPATFSLTRVLNGGDTTSHKAFRYSPVAYSGSYLEDLARGVARSGGPARVVGGRVVRQAPSSDSQSVYREIRSAMRFPDFQPPVLQVWVSNRNEAWLRRGETGEDGTPWLVLTASDDVRGIVTTPPLSRIRWAGGNVVWLLQLDEDGIPWAVRYRLE